MAPVPVTQTNLYRECRDNLSRHYRRVLSKALQEVRDSGIPHKFCALYLDEAFDWSRTPQGQAFWERMCNIIDGWE